MKKMESFMLLVSNLSDVYIFTVVTMFSVAAVTLYCTRIMNRNLAIAGQAATEKHKSRKKAKNSDTEEDDEAHDDETPLNSDSEDLSRDLVREMKTAKLKQIEETLTEEQIQEERRVESQQLAAIFELLKKQEEEFKTSGMDETEFKRQLSLYR